MEHDPYDQPVKVLVADGAIVIMAPEGSAIMALTPEAALESAERIMAAAWELAGEHHPKA